MDGHVNAVSRAFGVDVDSISKLHNRVGAGRAIFYTVFSWGVKLFLVYEFTHMVLQLSKDWSPVIQLLFRLLVMGIGLAAMMHFCARGLPSVLSVCHSLGTRVWTLVRSLRSRWSTC